MTFIWVNAPGTVNRVQSLSQQKKRVQAVRQGEEASSISSPLPGFNDSSSRAQKGISDYANYQAPQRRRLLAHHIMTKKVVRLTKNDSFVTATEIILRQQFRHLPVVAHNRVIGLLSDRDILAALATREEISSVADIMTHKVLLATGDTAVTAIASLFVEERIGAMPIVSEEQHSLLGLITRSDILRTINDYLPIGSWT